MLTALSSSQGVEGSSGIPQSSTPSIGFAANAVISRLLCSLAPGGRTVGGFMIFEVIVVLIGVDLVIGCAFVFCAGLFTMVCLTIACLFTFGTSYMNQVLGFLFSFFLFYYNSITIEETNNEKRNLLIDQAKIIELTKLYLVHHLKRMSPHRQNNSQDQLMNPLQKLQILEKKQESEKKIYVHFISDG